MPKEIEEAFDRLLLEHPEIEKISGVGLCSNSDVSEIHKDKGAWAFTIRLKEVVDKKGEPVTLEFSGDSLYPWSEVEVFTANYCGMPHQRLRDGKLCLDPEMILDADDRKLEGVYKQVLQWLKDAYTGQLARCGDPYEFPDFNHGQLTRIGKCSRLYYDEDGGGLSFVQGVENLQRFGHAELVFQKEKNSRQEAYLRRLHIGNATHQFAEMNLPVTEADGVVRTVPFIVFDDIVVENHRPPITWNELVYKIRAERSGAEEPLKREWESADESEGLLLVGWMVPKKYGGPVSCLAWRMASFTSRKQECWKVKKGTACCREKRLRAKSWQNSEIMDEGAYVSWGLADNINQSERLIRWRLSTQLRGSSICIVGCGALGSQVAELLVRGGCGRLVLVDPDSVEYGNLSRHTLTSFSVGKKKVSMLSFRLKSIVPNAEIRVFDCGLPGDGSESCQRVRDAVSKSNIVVDCTGDNNCGMWLSRLTGNYQLARGVRAFMSGAAEYLSLCFSGKNCSLRKVERTLNQTMQLAPDWKGMDWDRYKAKDELMVRGAGCWSATFPGGWTNITMFAGILVNRLDVWMQGEYDWDGEFSVYRCNSDAVCDYPLRLVGRKMC